MGMILGVYRGSILRPSGCLPRAAKKFFLDVDVGIRVYVGNS